MDGVGYSFRFALDLYTNELLDVELPFTNPFRRTTSVGYNSRTKVSVNYEKPSFFLTAITIDFALTRNCTLGTKVTS